MSRDPLGSDPLGVDPVSIVAKASIMSSREAVNFLKQGIVVRGVYVCPDREGPVEPVADPVGDDGKVLTLEDRQRIAAGRAKFIDRPFGVYADASGYHIDLTDRQVESMGESAQKEINKMPEISLLPVREAKIPETEV